MRTEFKCIKKYGCIFKPGSKFSESSEVRISSYCTLKFKRESAKGVPCPAYFFHLCKNFPFSLTA